MQVEEVTLKIEDDITLTFTVHPQQGIDVAVFVPSADETHCYQILNPHRSRTARYSGSYQNGRSQLMFLEESALVRVWGIIVQLMQDDYTWHYITHKFRGIQ